MLLYAYKGGISMLKKVLVLFFCLSISNICCAYQLITETYDVQEGDTLSTIAQDFIEKNTYSKRELKEFEYGIVEINPFLAKREKEGFILYVGETIKINYWIK